MEKSRFIDHGDGTITDTKTGLMWAKDSLCLDLLTREKRTVDNGDGTVTDIETKLKWNKKAFSDTSRAMKWGAAMKWVKELNLAGYPDWRLPTVDEMNTLIDRSNESPALPDGHPFRIDNDRYWTSTTWPAKLKDEEEPEDAWYVEMAFGRVDTEEVDEIYWAWPVRTLKIV